MLRHENETAKKKGVSLGPTTIFDVNVANPGEPTSPDANYRRFGRPDPWEEQAYI